MENTQVLASESSAWSLIQKFLFRFFGLYLALYIFPFPLESIFSQFDFVGGAHEKLWSSVANWVSANVLGLRQQLVDTMTGSGDRTYDFVILFTKLVLALFGAIVWSILDRKRPQYRKALYWLIVWVRYYLAVVAIGYGMAKVIKTQFPFPSLARLLEPYGESSPMGLAWTFMGYSTAFNWFTGLGEVIGGFLLFFRRTTTIGALILITVMGEYCSHEFQL